MISVYGSQKLFPLEIQLFLFGVLFGPQGSTTQYPELETEASSFWVFCSWSVAPIRTQKKQIAITWMMEAAGEAMLDGIVGTQTW